MIQIKYLLCLCSILLKTITLLFTATIRMWTKWTWPCVLRATDMAILSGNVIKYYYIFKNTTVPVGKGICSTLNIDQTLLRCYIITICMRRI